VAARVAFVGGGGVWVCVDWLVKGVSVVIGVVVVWWWWWWWW